MLTATLNRFTDRLRRGLPADPRADGELVLEYAATGSEAAFAELVRRFTPLVWGACRRAVSDRQLAEDAFQATFLVLVRKAGSVRPDAVGGWLHAVAVHTSTRARAMADRRRTRIQPLGEHDPASNVVDLPDADAVRALDDEISRLPDTLRAAVVLCELDGMSRKDAAVRLGIAEGTLSSRLASARKRLADRLRNRGVVLAVALALVSRTSDAAPLQTSTTSELASSLADGAIRTMFLSKLKLTATMAVLTVIVGAGSLIAAQPESTRHRFEIKAPVPKADKEGVIAIGLQEDGKNRIDLLTPKGEKVATIPLDPHPMYHLALSRDGKRVAVWAWTVFRTDQANPAPKQNQKITHAGTLLIYDVGTPDKPLLKLEGVQGGGCVFAPDGKTLYVNELAEPDEKKPGRDNTVSKLDLLTQKKDKLDVPTEHMMLDLSPDGKTLLTVSHAEKVKGEYGAATHLVPLDTLKPKLVSEANVACSRFSPDGTQLLGQKYTGGGISLKQELVTVNVKTGKDSPVKLEDDTYRIWNTAWSADGTKVLVKRDVLMPGAKPSMPVGNPGDGVWTVPDNRPELAIRNRDGSDPKPLLELKKGVHIFGIDWR